MSDSGGWISGACRWHADTVAVSHDPSPQGGTILRERDGELPSYPLAPWDFPLLATCQCGWIIRRNDSLFADWSHLEGTQHV
jgi:hypothetical protein